MKSVFIVQHLHVQPHGEEDVKLIGVYTSAELAKQAVARLGKAPGFRDHPRIVDPEGDGPPGGFYVDEYVLDHDNWVEGYTTS